MKIAEIVSINVGKPMDVSFHSKEISTGIFKTTVNGPLFLSSLNFVGDEQADLIHHGGKDKAVCVYPFEHYPYWENELQRTLAPAAFGENLTIRGYLEEDVCIGDIFKLGDALVQISQPRQPCYKLALRYDSPDMPQKVQDTGYTGFYFRVLEEGTVSNSSSLKRISNHPKAITVSYANYLMHHKKDDLAGIKRILELEELSESWRKTFLKRLNGDLGESRERLNGER